MTDKAINYIQLGKRIKLCRINKNLSYKELFHLSNVSEKTLKNIESGNSGISINNLISISNALNVSIDYLLIDSLKNKSNAIQFMLNHIFEGLNSEQAEALIATGYDVRDGILRLDSLK